MYTTPVKENLGLSVPVLVLVLLPKIFVLYVHITESMRSNSTPDQLWTSKYCPTSSEHLLVNKKHIEKINDWLVMWKQDINRGQIHTRNPTKKKKKRKALGFINGM